MNGLTRWHRPEIATWPSFGRLTDLRDEIDRLFEAPFGELAQASQFLSGWVPAIDLHEDKDNFYLRAELPGMKREDIDVSLHEGTLTLSGERKLEKIENAEVCRTERFVGRFQRTMSLPAPVAADRVKAQYKDGVLMVTLPKTEEAKPKHIDVKVS
jgi:HSP20 family protein